MLYLNIIFGSFAWYIKTHVSFYLFLILDSSSLVESWVLILMCHVRVCIVFVQIVYNMILVSLQLILGFLNLVCLGLQTHPHTSDAAKRALFSTKKRALFLFVCVWLMFHPKTHTQVMWQKRALFVFDWCLILKLGFCVLCYVQKFYKFLSVNFSCVLY